jgi:hypothetical protein
MDQSIMYMQDKYTLLQAFSIGTYYTEGCRYTMQILGTACCVPMHNPASRAVVEVKRVAASASSIKPQDSAPALCTGNCCMQVSGQLMFNFMTQDMRLHCLHCHRMLDMYSGFCCMIAYGCTAAVFINKPRWQNHFMSCMSTS